MLRSCKINWTEKEYCEFSLTDCHKVTKITEYE